MPSIKRKRKPLKIFEVQVMTGMSRDKCYKAVKDGSMASFRYGRTLLIPVEAVDKFMRCNTKKGSAQGNSTVAT